MPFNCSQLTSSLLFEITDTDGAAITSVDLGMTFELRVVVEPDVFAAYADILYPAEMATLDGPIRRAKYNKGVDLNQVSPGLLNDIGGFLGPDDLWPPNGGGMLFAVPFKATQFGNIQFTGRAPGRAPFTNLSVFNCDNSVPPTSVQWGEASVVVNRPPVLTHPGNKAVDEEQQLTFTLSASDTDVINGASDTVSYSIASGASPGMSLAAATGAFSWTPTEAQDGEFIVVFRATDNHGTKSNDQTVTITVNEINAAPVLINPGAKTVNEKAPLNFLLTATDADLVKGQPNKITFSMVSGAASGMLLGSSTGAFSWTPIELQDGKHVVVFRATDEQGIAAADKTVTLTVKETNEPPLFSSPTSQSISESQTLSFSLVATDSDFVAGVADTISTYALVSGQMPGMVFHGTGAFSWTPRETQDGQHVLVFRAADRHQGTTHLTQTITVHEIHSIPVLANPGNQTFDETTEIRFTLSATDADIVAGVPDTLSYSLASGSQTGMMLDSQSGEFRWRPTESQDGSFIVVFRAQDSRELVSLEQTVTVGVNELNSPPVLNHPGNPLIDETSELVFSLTAHDADLVAEVPDTFSYSLLSGAQAGMTFDTQSATFRWTPAESQDGKFVVVFRAKDNHELVSADQSVTITVKDVNAPPTLDPLATQSVAEKIAMHFTLVGADSDLVSGAADQLSYSIVSGEQPGMTLDQSTGTFRWTPTEEQDGQFAVVFLAQDTHALASAEQTAQITVTEVNEPPILSSPGEQTVGDVGSLAFTLSAVDRDVIGGNPNTLSYSIVSGAVEGMNLDATSGAFNWTPSATQTGSYAITFRVADPLGASHDQSIAITVPEQNHAPADILLTSLSIDENVPGAVIGEVTASDFDPGQTHTLTVENEGFEIVGGRLQLKPGIQLDFEASTTPLVTIIAMDSGSPPLSLTKSFTLTIRDINEPPTAILLSAATVKENIAGLTLGTLSATDPEAAQSHIFTTTDARFEIVHGVLRYKEDQYADLDDGPTIQVEITTLDSGMPPQMLSTTLVLDVIRNRAAWHNELQPFDTNGDGSVVPQDVLRIINQLNDPTIVGQDGRLPQARPVATDPPFYDTNGDGFCTPIDVLRVINFLNSPQSNAEGEAFGNSFVLEFPRTTRQPEIRRPTSAICPVTQSPSRQRKTVLNDRPARIWSPGTPGSIPDRQAADFETVIHALAQDVLDRAQPIRDGSE